MGRQYFPSGLNAECVGPTWDAVAWIYRPVYTTPNLTYLSYTVIPTVTQAIIAAGIVSSIELVDIGGVAYYYHHVSISETAWSAFVEYAHVTKSGALGGSNGYDRVTTWQNTQLIGATTDAGGCIDGIVGTSFVSNYSDEVGMQYFGDSVEFSRASQPVGVNNDDPVFALLSDPKARINEYYSNRLYATTTYGTGTWTSNGT